MTEYRYFHLNRSDSVPVFLVLVSSAFALAISLYSLNSGIYTIFQNLFYFPIILACFFYAKRGFVFSVVLSCLYVVLILAFTQSLEHIVGAVVRFILFILVAAVIASLSANQQRTKEALTESRRTLTDVINFLPDATFVRNLDGRIIVWNHAMERMTNTRSEEIVGKGDYEYAYRLFGRRCPILIDIVLQDDQELFRQKYSHVQNIDGVLSGDIEIENYHGRKAVIRAIAAPLRNDRGEIIGAIESIRNVTQFYDTRAQLQQANESLTLVNTKLHLINKITQHDLLNTIQVLSGYLEMIKQVAAGAQPLTEYAGEMDDLTHTLREQVEFARDYQSIGIEKPVWQNLRNTVARGLATATFTGVTVTVTIDSVEIYADLLFERVIYNLATNAVIHGRRTTQITFSTLKRGPDMVIVCKDDGIGIPERHKEAIFRREHHNNTGYGLFLAREILSITGLSIRETGTPGEGACFEILVPEGSHRSALSTEQ